MKSIKCKAIVNPSAGSNSVGRNWNDIQRYLDESGLKFDYEFTHSANHIVEVSSMSVTEGYDFLVAVGGDGTVNKVANGILKAPGSFNVTLGIIKLGTAHDYLLSICDRLSIHQQTFNFQNTCLIDVGKITYRHYGKEQYDYYINEASVGLPAEIVAGWNKVPTGIHHKINLYLRKISSYVSALRYRNKPLQIHVDGKTLSGKYCSVIIANGRYFADGMDIAPNARIDDGHLDIVVVGDLSTIELVRVTPDLYKGTHTGHEKFSFIKTDRITISLEGAEQKMIIEADGDVIGEGPITIDVIPSALNVVPIL